jgi:Zn-dependent protease with chaperone function
MTCKPPEKKGLMGRPKRRIAIRIKHRHIWLMEIKRRYIYWTFAVIMVAMTITLLSFYNLAGQMEIQRRGLGFLIGFASLITASISAALFYIGWVVRKSED